MFSLEYWHPKRESHLEIFKYAATMFDLQTAISDKLVRIFGALLIPPILARQTSQVQVGQVGQVSVSQKYS